MKTELYSVIIRHMGLSYGFAVRAGSPADAVTAVLAQGEQHAQHFSSIEVLKLTELEAPAAAEVEA